MPIVALLAIGVPFVLLVLSLQAERAKALGAATLGLVIAGLLALFSCAPGPEHTSEPHLEAYGEIIKLFVGVYAWPMLVVFVVALAAAHRRTRLAATPPLPRAIAHTDLRR